jgi:hypothetical protein
MRGSTSVHMCAAGSLQVAVDPQVPVHMSGAQAGMSCVKLYHCNHKQQKDSMHYRPTMHLARGA